MKHTEDKIQTDLIHWISKQHELYAPLFHHSPNGGQRSAIAGARLKAAGTRRGFPDLICIARQGGFSGLAIELKAPGGRVTHEQVWWLDQFAAQGWLTALCFSLDAAKETINTYFSQGPSHEA